jgi:uncharacterized protein (TIGR02611 family)
MEHIIRHSRRAAIAIIGGLVVLIGIVMIPYPGPGWLVVFAGLAILATEFDRAQRVLDYAGGIYENWQRWLNAQSNYIKMLVWMMTAIVVVLTIWLINGYGIINDWFKLDQDWLRSPIFS